MRSSNGIQVHEPRPSPGSRGGQRDPQDDEHRRDEQCVGGGQPDGQQHPSAPGVPDERDRERDEPAPGTPEEPVAPSGRATSDRLYRYPACIDPMHSRGRHVTLTDRALTIAARHAPSAPVLVDGDPRAQGARPCRVRPGGHLPQPATGVPAGARPRRGLRHRGHRWQPVPGLLGGYRGQLHGPRPSGRRGGDPAAGRRAHPLQRVRLLPAHLRPAVRPARGHRADVRAASGRTSATPAPRWWRRPSSSPSTPPIGRTWWRSWAASTAARMAP